MASTENDDAFPDTLDELSDNYIADSGVLECPDAEGTEYTYVAGLSASDPVDMVLLYESADNHQNGLNVLMLDGRVEWMQPQAFEAALNKTMAHIESKAMEEEDLE
jgi:prepilin-type processing-associated H-X9-DG protein